MLGDNTYRALLFCLCFYQVLGSSCNTESCLASNTPPLQRKKLLQRNKRQQVSHLQQCNIVDFVEGMPGSSDTLLKVPDEIFGSDSLTKFLNTQIQHAKSKINKGSSYKVLADVFLSSANDMSTLHKTGKSLGVTACKNLEVVQKSDVVAVGFLRKSDNKSFCTAFNPCEHTYAFSQVKILPEIPLSKGNPDMEATLDVVAISIGKELHTKSANYLWTGDGEPALLEMYGHFFVQGTCTLRFAMGNDMSLEVLVVSKLMFDMDPKGDGAFSPFAKGDNRQTDWAFMLSGEASPIIHLPGDKTLDLRGILKRTADMYVKVEGQNTEFQFGTSYSLELGGFCDASKSLDLFCHIFSRSTGLTGSLLMYFNARGFGFRMEVRAKFGLKSDFYEDMLNFPADQEIDAGLQLTYVGKSPEICVDWNGKSVCFGRCSSNSDCESTKFCDNVFKVCSKKRKNGGKCGQDSACMSAACVLGFCRECKDNSDCPHDDQYCTDKLSLNGPSQCQNKKDDGWKFCSEHYQCKNYCKFGTCKRCLKDSHCPSGQYCTKKEKCEKKRDKGWMFCSKGSQCKSGECSMIGKCK